MGMVSLIDMAADRGGVHLPEPEFELVGGKPQLQQPDVHAFYGWSKGLKTAKETPSPAVHDRTRKETRVKRQTGALRDVQF
jgi:hypothetical protein